MQTQSEKTSFNKIRLNYIGVVSLLGRLSNSKMKEEDLYCIKKALDDCCELFPDSFVVWKTGNGGYSLEPKI